jgi:hypothetical protein
LLRDELHPTPSGRGAGKSGLLQPVAYSKVLIMNVGDVHGKHDTAGMVVSNQNLYNRRAAMDRLSRGIPLEYADRRLGVLGR